MLNHDEFDLSISENTFDQTSDLDFIVNVAVQEFLEIVSYQKKESSKTKIGNRQLNKLNKTHFLIKKILKICTNEYLNKLNLKQNIFCTDSK